MRSTCARCGSAERWARERSVREAYRSYAAPPATPHQAHTHCYFSSQHSSPIAHCGLVARRTIAARPPHNLRPARVPCARLRLTALATTPALRTGGTRGWQRHAPARGALRCWPAPPPPRTSVAMRKHAHGGGARQRGERSHARGQRERSLHVASTVGAGWPASAMRRTQQRALRLAVRPHARTRPGRPGSATRAGAATPVVAAPTRIWPLPRLRASTAAARARCAVGKSRLTLRAPPAVRLPLPSESTSPSYASAAAHVTGTAPVGMPSGLRAPRGRARREMRRAIRCSGRRPARCAQATHCASSAARALPRARGHAPTDTAPLLAAPPEWPHQPGCAVGAAQIFCLRRRCRRRPAWHCVV